MVFQTLVSISQELISCGKNYSKSSFKPAFFNQNLFFLYHNLSENLPPSEFFGPWYDHLQHALSQSCLLKRSKRTTVPYYYSSHSNWSFPTSLMLKDKLKSLEESIELYKLILVKNFNLQNPKECFRLINTLEIPQYFLQ